MVPATDEPMRRDKHVPQRAGIRCWRGCRWCRTDPPPASRRRTASRSSWRWARDLLEALVALAGALAGREAVHGLGHRADVLLQVDLRAVVEEAAPLRIEPHEVEIVGEVASGLREDALQHARHGEDRRPHVEAEAVFVQHRRLAAEPGVLVVKRDLMAARGRDAGGRQAAQSSADDCNRSTLSAHDVLPQDTSLFVPRPVSSCVGSRNGMIQFKADHAGLGDGHRSCAGTAAPAPGSPDRSRPIPEAA